MRRSQILRSFWRKVQRLYKQNRLLQPDEEPGYPHGFFDRKWAGRGREYRTFVEPVNIANWCWPVVGTQALCSGSVAEA